MSESSVIFDLVLIIAAATAGGLLARWLRQPVILGYLVAGVFVGPHTPGPVADLERVRFLTEIGVALLLFVMGTEMVPSRFRKVGRVVVFGGLLQIGLTLLLGLALGPLIGLGATEGVFLGSMLALSSTVVAVKILQDREEIDAVHGRIAFGICIVQDLAFVPMLLLLLAFFGEEARTLEEVLLALGKLFGILTVTYLVGKQLWPRVLALVSKAGSQELMLLTTLSLALGGALAVKSLGLTFVVGAFLAGLVVAESRHRGEAVAGIVPIRDVFAALFFVSIGMLLNPRFVAENPLAVTVVVLAIVLGKAFVATVVVRLFRYPGETALLAGLVLAQTGELSFLLGRIGFDEGAIPESLFSLAMAAAAISILMNSLLLDSAPAVLTRIAKTTGFRALMKRQAGFGGKAPNSARLFGKTFFGIGTFAPSQETTFQAPEGDEIIEKESEESRGA